MKTKIITIIALFFASSVFSQNTYFTKNGTIDFFSSTLIEDIKAVNKDVVSFLKLETGEINFGVLINAFIFENGLMQEHFNENYMESEKFPKAKFLGKITNINDIDFKKEGIYDANVIGKITIHGVTREISVKGIIEVKPGVISIHSKFQVKPEDYFIEIPAVVRENIAKILDVNVNVDYTPYEN